MHAPLVIAHRGDSSRALENSTEAVRLALSLPADMIEIDIRKSRDNVLYVMHDKDTGRTSDRNINIEQSTSDEIALVRLKNGEPISSLDDVLRLVAGRGGLHIEVKRNGELIAACHERKIRVYVWTVDEEDEIKKFITWGVDGIYSNRPAVLKRLV